MNHSNSSADLMTYFDYYTAQSCYFTKSQQSKIHPVIVAKLMALVRGQQITSFFYITKIKIFLLKQKEER